MAKRFLGRVIAGAAIGGASLLVCAPSIALADGGYDGGHQSDGKQQRHGKAYGAEDTGGAVDGKGKLLTRPHYGKPGHALTVYEVCAHPQKHAWAWSEVTGKIHLKPKKDHDSREDGWPGKDAGNGTDWPDGMDRSGGSQGAGNGSLPNGVADGETGRPNGGQNGKPDGGKAGKPDGGQNGMNGADGQNGMNGGQNGEDDGWSDGAGMPGGENGAAEPKGGGENGAAEPNGGGENGAAEPNGATGTGPGERHSGRRSADDGGTRLDEQDTAGSGGMADHGWSEDKGWSDDNGMSDDNGWSGGENGSAGGHVYAAKVWLDEDTEPGTYPLKGSCGTGTLVVVPVGAADAGDGGAAGADSDLAATGAALIGAASLGGIVLLRRRRTDGALA